MGEIMENLELWDTLVWLWDFLVEWKSYFIAGLFIVPILLTIRSIHLEEDRDWESRTVEIAYGVLMIVGIIFLMMWGWQVILFALLALSLVVIAGHTKEMQREELIQSIDAVKKEIQELRKERQNLTEINR